MKKPTELEVKMQFELKGVSNPLVHQQYYAYYESVGWYVGKSKMKSWRASVAGWIIRMKQYEQTRNNSKSSLEDRLQRW